MKSQPIRGATLPRRPLASSTRFQSTRPIRGATFSRAPIADTSDVFQSTRPIRGATARAAGCGHIQGISIHAPHTGRDGYAYNMLAVPQIFQSTRPIRGATWLRCSSCFGTIHFNPRAPYGARRNYVLHEVMICPFQSTRPIRGATSLSSGGVVRHSDFNPRAPYGARRHIMPPKL